MLRAVAVILALLLIGCGRIDRQVTINSNPQGALVWANDQEIGRTPFTRDFTWYGTYDVYVRKDGYDTLHARTKVIAPWWQWPPIDLLVEILPGHWVDKREFTYDLAPASTQPADAEMMLDHAQELRLQLEGSKYTRRPERAPTSRAATTSTSRAETTQPATK